MPATATQPSYEQLLHDEVSRYYADPLGFVLSMFPWGEKGTTLEHHDGPDTWQHDFFVRLGKAIAERGFNGKDAVAAIRMAVSKGHGVGGSAVAGMLNIFIMSTRPHAQGTVTANTMTQLETKTWAAIRRWAGLCRTGHWFEINTQRMYRKGIDPKTGVPFSATWFCAAASCAEENSEAFAGQHQEGSTSYYINDEDSAVPDKIHEVEEGGLTDGEPMQFLFGNSTRNTGHFYRACHGNLSHRYDVTIVDSRTSKFTNKAQIAEWAEDWGEASDFFRVRVMGLPPQASELQFIGQDLVKAAQARTTIPLPDEPLIAGLDVSGGGAAWTVCRFRRGADAASMPPIRIPGSMSKIEDRPRIVAILAERLKDEAPGKKIAAMFIDGAFGAPIVERLHALGYEQVHEVTFGAPSPDDHQANQRAYQWNRMKEWLAKGAIPKDDKWLPEDLCRPGFHLNRKNQLVLESKESMMARGERSPDDGDALSLTFAQPVAVPRMPTQQPYRPRASFQ